MNLIRTIIFNLRGIIRDEEKQAKAAQFNELVVLSENVFGRPLRGRELQIMFNFDYEQTEMFKKWMEELAE